MAAPVQLTASQRSAVDYPWRGKISMIVSTAGSGKTLVLTHRVIRVAEELVSEGDCGARLLCVCYNRNAADEMRDRIASLLRDSIHADKIFVSRDSSRMPNMISIEVRTFHALGFYIIKSSLADERGCIALDGRPIRALAGENLKQEFSRVLQQNGLMSKICSEKWQKRHVSQLLFNLSQEKGVHFNQECAELLTKGTLAHDYQRQKREFEVYEEMLSENNAVDYNDMLRKAVMLLYYSKKSKQRIERRYRAVLVDEFQDMSSAQVSICKSLADQNKSLTLVGDDDQQIYSFRTGLGWCCHEFLRSVFPNIDTLTLTENHRCTGAVVKAAYVIINNNTNRIPKDIMAARERGLPLQVIGCKTQRLELDFVVKKVRSLLPKARKHGHRMILLFRRNNMLKEFQRRFTRERIPTSRRTAPSQRTQRIGSQTLKVYAMFSMMNPNIAIRDFIWAVTAVSPCLEESFIQSILDSQNSEVGSNKSEPPQAEVKSGTDIDVMSEGLNRLSPFLWKVRLWYKAHLASSDDTERCYAELLQKVVSCADELELKSKTVRNLETLVHFVATLLDSNHGASEAMLSSQHAFSHGAEGQVSSYGTEDPDEQNLDCEAFDVLVSVARVLDEKMVKIGNAADISSEPRDENGKDSDEEDFAQLFCKDRDERKVKRRCAAGINPAGIKQNESVLNTATRLQQIVQLCENAGKKFKIIDKQWLRTEADYNAITVLSTAHGAKGCTFPYVFLCGADEDEFPVNGSSRTMGDTMPLKFGSNETVQTCTRAENRSYQEERRLFFVALTRTVTEFTCTYSAGGFGAASNSRQSPFIREMLQGLQWDPEFIVESFVNSQEDVVKISERRNIMKSEAVKTEHVKEEQKEVG